jgi:hypothetical protein
MSPSSYHKKKNQFSSIILRVGRGISQGDGENGLSSNSLSHGANKEISIGVSSNSSSMFSRDLRHWVHPHPPLPLHYHKQAQTPAAYTESGYSVNGIPMTGIRGV